ncbi:hypothetical protein MKY91_20620 [Alkalicoccobacillus gibsonii]|uniref:DUF3139 domain-containing protein n=1 Tax=Alkalicoccobacillus gibsonii TaxID=79881 RepID=A0ABU9VQX1_9BACI
MDTPLIITLVITIVITIAMIFSKIDTNRLIKEQKKEEIKFRDEIESLIEKEFNAPKKDFLLEQKGSYSNSFHLYIHGKKYYAVFEMSENGESEIKKLVLL